MKQGYVPLYDFMTISGKSNQFVCKVFCKDLNAEGTGNSKKEAKQKAAENMLLLLGQTSDVSMSSTISSLSVGANKTQNSLSTMICDTSPSSSVHLQLISEVIDLNKNIKKTPSDPCKNYIGILQEFCVQNAILPKDISYKTIDESGPSHLRSFVVEVSVGSLRAQGVAQSKKTAKQEAAKNLYQILDVNALSKINQNHSNGTSELLEFTKNMQKLDITSGNVNCKPALPIAELSEKAQSRYLECTNKVSKTDKHGEHSISDLHLLFEDTYSTKIPDDIKAKMQIVRIEQESLIKEIRQYIEHILGLKIERFVLHKSEIGFVVGLRLIAIHNITQISQGVTKNDAENRAMYNIITAISILLN